jgi:hypothetical protein
MLRHNGSCASWTNFVAHCTRWRRRSSWLCSRGNWFAPRACSIVFVPVVYPASLLQRDEFWEVFRPALLMLKIDPDQDDVHQVVP